jgi:hypothetical protein
MERSQTPSSAKPFFFLPSFSFAPAFGEDVMPGRRRGATRRAPPRAKRPPTCF